MKIETIRSRWNNYFFAEKPVEGIAIFRILIGLIALFSFFQDSLVMHDFWGPFAIQSTKTSMMNYSFPTLNIFQHLTTQGWYQKPETNLKFINWCKASGLAPSPNCPTVRVEASQNSRIPVLCSYHQVVHLNEAQERVFKGCLADTEIIDTSWFVLDPIVSHYYKRNHPNYYNVPSFS